MGKEFKVPELGEGIESAEVAQLYVAEGDTIEADQNILELESDKAIADLPCPFAGRIEKLLVKQGDTIQVGQAVLILADDGPASEPSVAEEKPPAPAPEPASPTPEPQPQPAVAAAPVERDDRPIPPAGPATRRLARELGVDLHSIAGTATGGRITQADVVKAHQVKQGGGAIGPAAAPPLPDFSQFGPVDREPLNKVARTAAAHLQMSWNVIPHVTHHEMADITELEASRKKHNQLAGERAPKVTLTAIAVKAVTAALREFPKFNASLDDRANELVLKRYYHIGVAADTEHGLLVPVIRDADKKSVIDIADELIALAEKARSRKLGMDEMRGATFTISNLGGIGGVGFTPIVNHPEVAILGLSRSRPELRMVGGVPHERLMMPMSLSYDHRVINGADAARFMARLADMFSDPIQLLFER